MLYFHHSGDNDSKFVLNIGIEIKCVMANQDAFKF